MQRIALGLLLPIVVVAVWSFVGASSPAAHGVISTPAEVVVAFLTSAGSGMLWVDVGASLLRALGGWAAALVLAAPLGIAMARIATFRHVLGPLLNVLRP